LSSHALNCRWKERKEKEKERPCPLALIEEEPQGEVHWVSLGGSAGGFDCAELDLTAGLETTHRHPGICYDLTSPSGPDLILAAHLPAQGDKTNAGLHAGVHA